MYTYPEPKDENITIRVTKKQFEAFNEEAYKNGLSRSEWGHNLLFKHKNDNRKSDRFVQSMEIEGMKADLINRILVKLQIKNKTQDTPELLKEIQQLKLAIKILDMTTFKSDYVIDELIRGYHSSALH